MTGADLLRWVIVALTVTGLAVWLRFFARRPLYRLAAVAPLSWLLHVLIFYGARETGLLDAATLNIWSNAVRLHAVILCTSLGVIALWK